MRYYSVMLTTSGVPDVDTTCRSFCRYPRSFFGSSEETSNNDLHWFEMTVVACILLSPVMLFQIHLMMPDELHLV